MTFHYRHRKAIILISCILLLLSGLGTYLFYIFKDHKKEKEVVTIKKNSLEKKTIKEEADIYTVDIKGEINLPGIYTLKKGSRVIDVITKAGGLTENSDTSVLNLSKKIQDEMVIIVYSREEVLNFETTKEKEKNLQSFCIQKDENALINDACIGDSNKTNNKVSINKASKEQLMTLKGIGETKAEEIIKYRETNGPFQKIEDLIKVPGIGESRFAAIKEDITV